MSLLLEVNNFVILPKKGQELQLCGFLQEAHMRKQNFSQQVTTLEVTPQNKSEMLPARRKTLQAPQAWVIW